MDVQLKRGLLEICVLSAIKYSESYGYRIIKDMQPYLKISESTLYPILKRLEEGKMLTVRSEEYNGRLRKYYRITDLGRKRLDAFAQEWKEVMSVYEFVTREESHEQN
ncbi:MAG: PadR family transcriptional regulator [Lachnospiraceae bacterium]|nr:PadR family transcriptional regulator [Lachnospiraceae bacterium]